ncbi:aldo/keto reductase [Streptomyces virginiae]|uniref:Aldo/keto reductase n=1 Tax=Streptomyces virginiae TaxID=1961 RepID=A0ABZ1TS82_STRVG|nr:aldo/keto reductase [Streptomyces virginiae]
MTAEPALGTHRLRATVTGAAARTACEGGSRWIDTAPNYDVGTVHRQLRPVLEEFPAVRVATKTGFYTPAQGEEAVEAGVLHTGLAEARHSLAPGFLDWQTRRSTTDLGRADIVFVHNPETVGHGDRDRLHAELRAAFAALEDLAGAGLIGGYGVATWTGFTEDAFTIPELLTLAREAGGPGHHLAAVQQPVSLVMAHPITRALDGHGPLAEARSAGLLTFGSAPLHGGELLDLVNPELVEFIRPNTSPAMACLLAAGSCPSLDVLLVSASTPDHWNTAVAALDDPLTDTELRKVLDVLAPR